MRRKLTKCGTAVIVRVTDTGWIHTQNYWGPSIQCDSCLELYEADPPSGGFGTPNNGGFFFDPLSREVKKTPFLCENCQRIKPKITFQKYS